MEPDSWQMEANDNDFWSYDLHPIDLASFTEPFWQYRTLLPGDDLMKYFKVIIIINGDFFEMVKKQIC